MKQKIFAAIAAATVLLAGTPALALTQPQLDCPTQGTGKQGAEKLAMAMLTDDDGHASAIAEGDKLSAMVKTCMAQFKIADDLHGLYFDYSMHRISHDGCTSLLTAKGFPVAVIDRSFDFGPGRSNPVITELADSQINKLIGDLTAAGFQIEGVPQSTWKLVGAYIIATSRMYEKGSKLA